ncbi:unnamed protein product [Miscanthus lutarioriparius]|uniref:Uncharacterized protein n=1 Tax=Miscanthus lutarioriparius TaxID=422564 RepID=A0A811SFN4_9POAL|nr:unnamed protein product [Miscanthus lutarioriparius]
MAPRPLCCEVPSPPAPPRAGVRCFLRGHAPLLRPVPKPKAPESLCSYLFSSPMPACRHPSPVQNLGSAPAPRKMNTMKKRPATPVSCRPRAPMRLPAAQSTPVSVLAYRVVDHMDDGQQLLEEMPARFVFLCRLTSATIDIPKSSNVDPEMA